MSLPTVAGLTILESYVLQRTVFLELAFHNLCLRVLVVNIVLKLLYHVVLWPRFLSPLRHLPQVKVCT